MEDRAAKFRKYIEQLPRLCSPTICGTLSQPTTKAERNNKSPIFEWTVEQKAILSPANITTATCSDIGELEDHSFLHQESEQFFSQKMIAPSPMTTPSTRPYSRSQPVPNRLHNFMFDERDEDTESDEDTGDEAEEDEDGDEGGEDDTEEYMDEDMQVVDRGVDDDDDVDVDDTDKEDFEDTDDDDAANDANDDDDIDDEAKMRGDQDMDSLFLSPPMRSSQTQQRFDIFSPETFDKVMDDENTLQSTPKTIGSQVFRTRTRRGSEMSD